jgi:hypothetical protein
MNYLWYVYEEAVTANWCLLKTRYQTWIPSRVPSIHPSIHPSIERRASFMKMLQNTLYIEIKMRGISFNLTEWLFKDSVRNMRTVMRGEWGGKCIQQSLWLSEGTTRTFSWDVWGKLLKSSEYLMRKPTFEPLYLLKTSAALLLTGAKYFRLHYLLTP